MDWSCQTGLQYRHALWAVAAPVMQLQDASHSAPPGPSRSRLSPPPGREGSPPGVQSMSCRMSGVHLAFVQLRISAQTKLWTLMQVQHCNQPCHPQFAFLVASFIWRTCRHNQTYHRGSSAIATDEQRQIMLLQPAIAVQVQRGLYILYLAWF